MIQHSPGASPGTRGSLPLDCYDLNGQTAVVTGASSGLGARFATVLAQAGASVVACGRRLDRLDQLARQHERIVPIQCDISSELARVALIEQAAEVTGRIDVLVNNAGISGTARPDVQAISEFRSIFEINTVAAFHLSQLVAPAMREAGSGAIVNVSSVLGLVAGAPISDAAYVASKGALIALTRELAVHWAGYGIRVNALVPGWFATEMTQNLSDDARSSAWIARNTPLGRFGTVDELDGVLLFLVSDASTFCTGSVIVIDGGWTSR